MSVGVIIVAGGRGTRLGASQPKQLLEIGGRSILQRAIAAFDTHPRVEELVVVLPEELIADAAAIAGAMSRPCVFAAGGGRRQDSVRAGFERLSSDVDLVLIHDAARPFVAADVIDRVVAAARESGAAVPAVAVSDTVKRVSPDGRVAATVARDGLWLSQTPQGFSRAVIAAAMAAGNGQDVTDEAMLIEQQGGVVRVVEGDPQNVKITTAADLATARGAYAFTPPRVGTGYDLHRLVDGRALVLAGVTLSSDRGPMSHSDGDVLCHALTDAILGAACLGDIGRHFSNTDPRWKDAPGLDLLGRAVAIVGASGWHATSADITVILERPKLAPHVDAIRAAIATVLGVSADAISVKGKTNEGVDAVGRGEAIAAHAVAVVARSADPSSSRGAGDAR